MDRTGSKADIYHAARVGDLERIKHLVEDEEVDVNRRDRWDSVPLYYACLAGDIRLKRFARWFLPCCNPRPNASQAGSRVLHCAGQSDVAHYLLEAGAVLQRVHL